ncbi:MAG: ABC transporter permease subunit [Spirochaetes bacterium]|nr:ABC transporter permease subunit [Spirochaetota bacterium]
MPGGAAPRLFGHFRPEDAVAGSGKGISSFKLNWKGILLFLIPILTLYGMFFIYPLIYVFFISLTEWNGVGAPEFVGLKNYIRDFQSDSFRLSLRNNFIWAFSLGFIQIGLAAMVAMILARKPPAWRLLRTVYFLPNVISKVAIAMLWLALYNAEFGAINAFLEAVGLEQWTHNWLGEVETALPAVILQELLYIGYFMIIILAGTMSVPESFYESAQIDGANVWQQERYITIPMIRGVLVTAMTLAIAFGLRHFEATFLMTRGGPANTTSVMALLLYRKLSALEYGVANSIGATLVAVGAVVIVFVRRFIGRRDAVAESMQ